MYYLILIIVAVAVVAFLLARKGRQVVKNGAQEVVGICQTALDQTIRKNANKEKILALLAEKGEMANSDIREHLGVAGRTVVKYMDALEQQGKVEQVGKTGRWVVYRLKQV